MNEFASFDLRQWLRDGLIVRPAAAKRSFGRKRRTGQVAAGIALSLITAMGALAYSSPSYASQVQSLWPERVQGLSQRASPPDLSLVPGHPEQYWSNLTKEISGWEDVPESEATVDVPPLL